MLCYICGQPEMRLNYATRKREPLKISDNVTSLQCARCTQRMLIKTERDQIQREQKEKEAKGGEKTMRND